MTENFIGDLAVFLIYFAPFMVVLGVGGLIADYVFPHIPFIQRFLDSLPEYEDEEDE